jgi:hypothetical protein
VRLLTYSYSVCASIAAPGDPQTGLLVGQTQAFPGGYYLIVPVVSAHVVATTETTGERDRPTVQDADKT